MPVVALGIGKEHGGVCLLVVVREHNFQAPVGGDEADGMVVVKPTDSGQRRRQQRRVACRENKQQDRGDELSDKLHEAN